MSVRDVDVLAQPAPSLSQAVMCARGGASVERPLAPHWKRLPGLGRRVLKARFVRAVVATATASLLLVACGGGAADDDAPSAVGTAPAEDPAGADGSPGTGSGSDGGGGAQGSPEQGTPDAGSGSGSDGGGGAQGSPEQGTPDAGSDGADSSVQEGPRDVPPVGVQAVAEFYTGAEDERPHCRYFVEPEDGSAGDTEPLAGPTTPSAVPQVRLAAEGPVVGSLYFSPEICLTGFSGQSEITLTVQQPDGSSWSSQVEVLDEYGSTESYLTWEDPFTGLGVYRIEAQQDGVSASLDARVAPEPQPTRRPGHGGFLLSGFEPGQRVAVQLYSGPWPEATLSWVASDTVIVDAQGQARYLVPEATESTCWGLLVEGVVDPSPPQTACF